jgi:Flp pilus assembly protein CpaB
MVRKDTIIIGAAVAAGVLSFVLLTNYLKHGKSEGHSVVAATQDLAVGSIIKKEQLGLSRKIKGIDPREYFIDIDDAVGRTVNKAVAAKHALPRASVDKPAYLYGDGNSEGRLPIPDDMLGMTLSSKDVPQMPSYVAVGQYVDVLGFASSNSRKSTLVYSAPVISLSKDRYEKVESISIGLLPDESEIIASALRNGQLHLLARSKQGVKPERGAEMGRVDVDIIRGVEEPEVASFEDGKASYSKPGSGVGE